MRWWAVGRWALPGVVVVVAWWSSLPGARRRGLSPREVQGLLEEVGP